MFCRGFGGFAGYGPYGYGASGSLGIGWYLINMGFRLLIFIGVIILAVKLYKRHHNFNNNSMRILDEKFAKGEINEEEYLKKKTILSKKN
ncbi:SHOCT domain-containing protein [Candidatus Clostridium radicumherbarum]|uniref:SHOCT domain-containing protein n=1 Tax=Candidatus Clostridium radicumherbarum TaxID=3381662 RepID=A0ABW8TZ80_9CLOT